MTFKEAQDFVLSEGRETADYMRLKVRRYLNRVMHTMLSRKLWTFMFEEDTVTLSVDTESYTWNAAPFPTDMDFVKSLHWVDIDGTIEPVSPWEFDSRYPDPTDHTGRPTAFTVKNDKIYFNTKWSDSEDIRIVYYKSQADFSTSDATDDGSSPPWEEFDHLNDAWIWGAMYWMSFFKDDERADECMRNYELALRRGMAQDSKMAEERITMPRHTHGSKFLGTRIYPPEMRYIL